MKALKILLLTFCFGVQAPYITPKIAFPNTLQLALHRAFIPSSHSNLYVPELPVEDVILYFNEVCLDSEYVESGVPSVVQKWTTPIKYILLGSYTAEDRTTIQNFATELNSIKGFPGMNAQQCEEVIRKLYY